MKNKKVMASICAGILSTLTLGAANVSADSDGCWTGRHSNGYCLKIDSVYEDGNKTFIELTNQCTDRLYMRWCANDRCGADGLRGGQTKKKYEFVTNARVRAAAIGSKIPSKDWVCSGKYDGWRDF